MPNAITSISFEIDIENKELLNKAHKAVVQSLSESDCGFISGELFELIGYEGAYIHIWRWENEDAAAKEPIIRATNPEVKAYFSFVADEPLYTEAVLVE